jgi:predicted transport protein
MTFVDTGGGEQQPGQVQERPGQSYARLVAGRHANGRKKLNVLDIIPERKDNKISYNLKKDELAKLLFKKMKLDPKNVLKVDTSGSGKILVEFNNNVNVESLVSLPAFDICDGLRVKYYKPHHRKETFVTISWLDLETPDELLVHLLNYFGQVKSNVRWSKIRQEDGEGELEKLLNNILSGERQLWMEISHSLPS